MPRETLPRAESLPSHLGWFSKPWLVKGCTRMLWWWSFLGVLSYSCGAVQLAVSVWAHSFGSTANWVMWEQGNSWNPHCQPLPCIHRFTTALDMSVGPSAQRGKWDWQEISVYVIIVIKGKNLDVLYFLFKASKLNAWVVNLFLRFHNEWEENIWFPIPRPLELLSIQFPWF